MKSTLQTTSKPNRMRSLSRVGQTEGMRQRHVSSAPADERGASGDDVGFLPPSAALIRLPEVMKRVALGRTAIYGFVKSGQFPPPVKVGGASAWVDVEVTRWIERLMVARDQLNARLANEG